MIKAGNYMMAQMPIRMMEMEHAEHGEHLDVLKSLTNNMTPPAECLQYMACTLQRHPRICR